MDSKGGAICAIRTCHPLREFLSSTTPSKCIRHTGDGNWWSNESLYRNFVAWDAAFIWCCSPLRPRAAPWIERAPLSMLASSASVGAGNPKRRSYTPHSKMPRAPRGELRRLSRGLEHARDGEAENSLFLLDDRVYIGYTRITTALVPTAIWWISLRLSAASTNVVPGSRPLPIARWT